MVLSEKQRLDVNRAVLDYLIDAGLSESATSFAAEVGIEAADLDDKSRGLLEKKWTSVVRLQVRPHRATEPPPRTKLTPPF